MKISKLIKLLKEEMEREGDMEIKVYDSHGDEIKPKCLQVGCMCRGNKITDYAYISDLE